MFAFSFLQVYYITKNRVNIFTMNITDDMVCIPVVLGYTKAIIAFLSVTEPHIHTYTHTHTHMHTCIHTYIHTYIHTHTHTYIHTHTHTYT